MNKFIIELFTYNPITNKYDKKDDCTMSVNDDGNFVIENKVKYLSVNLKKDNVIILDRRSSNMSFEYEMSCNNLKFGIRFDVRSSAAEKHFFNVFNKIRSGVVVIEKYASGRNKIEGMKSDTGFNGMCIEYYDLDNSPIKYIGEFEDSVYDGHGEFFTEDGMIRLVCDNICSGKPNGMGRLYIIDVLHKIQFKEFKTKHTLSKEYIHELCLTVDKEYQERVLLENFKRLSTEDRTIELYKMLRSIINNKISL